MDLSQVSRTAILLLICRAVETEKNKSGFNTCPGYGPREIHEGNMENAYSTAL